MKTLKNIFYFLAAASLVGFTSCSDDDATTSLKGAQIFFSTELPSTVEIEKGQSSVQLSIERMNATEAISVPLFSTDESGLFSMPTEVSFNAGETSAKVTVNFSFDALTTDVSYPLQITIGDTENSSPYGLSSYSFNIIYPAPYTSLGSAQYTEDLLTAVYGIGNDTFPIEIQQSDENPGVYRLKNLYNVNSPFFQLYSFSDGSGTTSDYYITIDCSDPEAVTIAKQPLGFTLEGMGELSLYSTAPGSFKDGVITFPKEGLSLVIPSYSDNYPTNASGLFKVVLPGASDVAAPAVTVAYLGSFIDGSSATTNAVFSFTLNETATSYKFAVVEGNITKDEAALTVTAGKIVDGSLESTEGTASGNVLHPLTVSGTFTVVAVPFNAEGESGATAAASFIYSAEGAPELVKVQTGNYSVHVANAENGYDYLRYVDPVSDWYRTLVLCAYNQENSGNYYTTEFPVEISEDMNTITIKPVEQEGLYYCPGFAIEYMPGYPSWNFPTTQSGIVLTRATDENMQTATSRNVSEIKTPKVSARSGNHFRRTRAPYDYVAKKSVKCETFSLDNLKKDLKK